MAPAKRVPTADLLHHSDGSQYISKYFIGSPAIRHSAIGPQPSMKHWRLSHNQVSTKPGEGHLLVRFVPPLSNEA